MSDVWSFRDPVSERTANIKYLGFTERQARFLVTVMLHSGVFIERQYCRFAGIAHGQKTHDFIDRLIHRGLAREMRPGALHRGRLYHVHHKRLYGLIGRLTTATSPRATEPNDRAADALDAVLADGDCVWLGTRQTSRDTCPARRVPLRYDPPHLTFDLERATCDYFLTSFRSASTRSAIVMRSPA
jgi:hypothetical protein